MNNLNKAVHSKKLTEACKKAAVAHAKMNKTEFITKHLHCVGENAIANFNIYEDSVLAKDLDLFEQSIKEDKWISIKDELPKEKDYILIYDHGTIYGYWNGENFQAFSMGLSRFINVEPTHWQPLPKPPKQ